MCSDAARAAASYRTSPPLERVDFVVEGVFDPRGEFDGLGGFDAPPEARHCFRALHFRAVIDELPQRIARQ